MDKKLTETIEKEIVDKLACYHPAASIRKYLLKKYEINLSIKKIYALKNKISNIKYFKECRQEYLDRIGDKPLINKEYRISEIQRDYDRVKRLLSTELQTQSATIKYFKGKKISKEIFKKDKLKELYKIKESLRNEIALLVDKKESVESNNNKGSWIQLIESEDFELVNDDDIEPTIK